MSQSFVSGGRIQLAKKLNPADATLTATTDLGITNGRLYFKNDSQEEWIDFSAVAASGSNYAYTINARLLSATADPSTSTGTGKTWLAASIGYNVQMHDQMVDKKTGLAESYANAAARDAAITVPVNGMQVYLTAEGYFTDYIAGAWVQRATGATPNASTTVAGKIEIATQAEVDSVTDTGGTGALLGVIPSTLDAKVMKQTSLVNSGITGEVKMWSAAVAPTNWLLCDGSAINRVTYAALFALIGTTYGVGDTTTTFNIPNMKGNVVVGYDAGQAEFNALGKTGGEKTHLLTGAESGVAAHSHTVNNGSGGASSGISATTAANCGTAVTTSTTGNTNAVSAHNNLQPYITLNYIIRY